MEGDLLKEGALKEGVLKEGVLMAEVLMEGDLVVDLVVVLLKEGALKEGVLKEGVLMSEVLNEGMYMEGVPMAGHTDPLMHHSNDAHRYFGFFPLPPQEPLLLLLMLRLFQIQEEVDRSAGVGDSLRAGTAG